MSLKEKNAEGIGGNGFANGLRTECILMLGECLQHESSEISSPRRFFFRGTSTTFEIREDKNSITPFGALMRYKLKQPGGQIILLNINSKAFVMRWQCSTKRLDGFWVKEVRNKELMSYPASSPQRSPLFSQSSFHRKDSCFVRQAPCSWPSSIRNLKSTSIDLD